MGYRLIVGLGNPGLEYRNTRHNAGFLVLERIANLLGLKWQRSVQLKAKIAVDEEKKLILLCPQTYMNLSGRSVVAAINHWKISLNEILEISDECDLAVGALKLKQGGSSGGHSGRKSIIDALGTDQYPKLRLGIGRPLEGQTLEDYVLENFTQEEKALLPLDKAADSAFCWLEKGINDAMNQVNCKEKS